MEQCIKILIMQSKLRLPSVISDGMMLQRDSTNKIWGWASPESLVKVFFMGQSYGCNADEKGKWSVILPPKPFGKPFEIKVSSENEEIVIKNVVLGDVFLCSGQSNMELMMNRLKDKYPEELHRTEYYPVRQFKMPIKYNFDEKKEDIPGLRWQQVSSDNIEEFSGTAYFFACTLYEKTNVPVGFVNASHGGSPVQAWFDEKTLSIYPKLHEEFLGLKDSSYAESLAEKASKEIQKWYSSLDVPDIDKNCLKVMDEMKWLISSDIKDKSFDDIESDEKNFTINLPCDFKPFLVKNKVINEDETFAGVLFFYREFSAPEKLCSEESNIWLGTLIDSDEVFINGVKVGSIGYMYPPRKYRIPAGLLKKEKNTVLIAVTVTGLSTSGGFTPDKPFHIFSDDRTCDIPLKGVWNCHVCCKTEKRYPDVFLTWKPGALYNEMIAPVENVSFRGVVWYQAESNGDSKEDALLYRDYFEKLIYGWRNNLTKASCCKGNLPFIYAQLPNFGPKEFYNDKSTWAILRKAQLDTLKIADTGMGVNIDIGEWNDLHPENKKDLGKRLANEALRIVFGDESVSKPTVPVKASCCENGKISVKFDTDKSHLVSKSDAGFIRGFFAVNSTKAIEARGEIISDNTVLLEVEKGFSFDRIRYCWTDSPAVVDLYDSFGNPVTPFELEVR